MSRDNSLRIGGDAHGPVVVGDNNRVDGKPAGPTQHNTAKDGGTVFAVMNGNQDIDRHDEEGPEQAQPH